MQSPWGAGGPAPEVAAAPSTPPLPDPRDPRFALERETLKLVLQHPAAVANVARDVGSNDFTHPVLRAVWEAAAALNLWEARDLQPNSPEVERLLLRVYEQLLQQQQGVVEGLGPSSETPR